MIVATNKTENVNQLNGFHRLPEKFQKKICPEPNSGCWIWIGNYHQKTGYGLFGVTNKIKVGAHRIVFEIFNGKIMKGLEIDHLCRVRRCVNPDHLEAVTPRENKRRGNGCSGINARKLSCKRGHLFDTKNTYVSSAGRHCRKCRNMHAGLFRLRRGDNANAIIV